MQRIEQTLDSREVAGMVNKDHSKLLRDIRTYIDHLAEAKIGFSDFFKDSQYKDCTGRTLPCYKITKKGCEFIAHKLTGMKGTIFTARYINRFHEMEDMLTGAMDRAKDTWFVRKFRGRYIVLERDFIAITGVDIKRHKLFYKTEYFRAGGDWNGWATRNAIDPEQFLLEYGFEYGNDDVMIYLYPSGVRKALKILQTDKTIEMRAGAAEMLINGITRNSAPQEYTKQLNSEPVISSGKEEKRETTVMISITLDKEKADLMVV